MLLIIACSSQVQPTSHKIYNYKVFQGPSNATFLPGGYFLLQPGNRILVSWQPVAEGEAVQAAPTEVTLTVELIGPFSSPQPLQQAQATGRKVDGPVVASASPIHTDAWTNKIFTSTLMLPSQRTPSYYLLIQQVCEEGNGSNGCFPGRTIIESSLDSP